jgi:5-methylcytosine-specific restriction endonuclease McrA
LSLSGVKQLNGWNIPASLEAEVRARDTSCVYCHRDFSIPAATRGEKPSWEHIINDETIITRTNISLCCMSCNASKGAKDLRVWLMSNYCQSKGIDRNTVADIVKVALAEIEKAA